MFIFASMLCGNFEQSKIITLESDKTVKLFDNYSAKFIYFEKQIFNSHSNIVAKIEVYDSNKTYTFSPSFSYKNNEKKFIMPLLLPSVQHDGTNDIYISPLFHSVDTQMEYNILIQNEKRSAKIDKNIFIKLLNINKNNAIIEIDNLQQKDTMSLTLELKNEKKDNYLWYNLPNSNYQIALTEFFAKENNEENKVIVIYKEVDSNLPEPIEIVKIEFSTKPYMFFVWLGLSIFVFGLFLNCLLPFHHKNY